LIVASSKISEDDCRRILSLFEMTQRAFQDGADEHIKNEGANAVNVLIRLLAKYGLNLGDIPDIQRQHSQSEAAKAAKIASTATAAETDQSNVLELTRHVLQGYADMQSHEYVAVVLWYLYTHVFDRFQISPRLALLSPVRSCGKSKALKLAERLTANPERHDGITAPTLYRLIEQGAPTLLLDEGDNAGLKIDRVMRQVVNSGYLQGGVISRTIKNEVKKFSTFAPLAIGAIGTLPLPLLRRSFVISMHRSSRTDLKTFEAFGDPEEIKRQEALRRLIVAWAQTAQFDRDPKLPKALRGWTADNWRVLVSVADSFQNTYWSEAARDAAVTFADGYFDEDACVSLLYDIRAVFRTLETERIKSLVLTEKLNELEDGAGIWNAYRGENDDLAPHPITPGEVAALLRKFDRNLRPKPLFEQLGSHKTRGKAGRGYYAHQFERWWAIYCPEDTNETTDNVRQLHQKKE
jgi:Protein of unknown function (DUF3631)